MNNNIIGIPKEIKNNEKRISLKPKHIEKFINIGFTVFIQKDAGLFSGFYDEDYIKIGAIICDNIEDIYKNANIIIKVKEPQIEEYKLIKKNHILFSFFHFAGNIDLLNAMIKSNSCCIAYESIEENGCFPILKEMSILAGENAIIEGTKFKCNKFDNIVTIIGLGNVGFSAFKKALNIGYKNINLIDIDYNKLINIKKDYDCNIYKMTSENLNKILKISDIVIGCIYINQKKTEKIINIDMLNIMPNNSIFIDIAIDQGGMTELSRIKTIEDPIIKHNNMNIYCVPNIPSLNPQDATNKLSEQIYKYLEKILYFNQNTKNIIYENDIFKNAINIDNGIILNNNLLN